MPDVIQGSLHISMKENIIPIFQFLIMHLEKKNHKTLGLEES